ncbi:MAG: hypothetical protein WCA44_04035 [Acidobacteriaceae bacterium]
MAQAADDDDPKKAADSVSNQDEGSHEYVPIDSTMVDPTDWE